MSGNRTTQADGSLFPPLRHWLLDFDRDEMRELAESEVDEVLASSEHVAAFSSGDDSEVGCP